MNLSDYNRKQEKITEGFGSRKTKSMNKLSNIVKIALAVFFFMCLMKMPYGYYEFIRFVAMIGFAYLVFEANELKRSSEMFIYIALAILFQPFFKIALGREIWNILDVVVGVGLIASVFIKREEVKQ